MICVALQWPVEAWHALQPSQMLHSRADSQQRQLCDVLAFHIIPRLSLRDAWALSQTCSSLWQLVQKGLPGTTYGSLARNTFPAGHPILAADDSHMQTEISNLAALHASVRSGHVISATTSCLREGMPGPLYAPYVPDHGGQHALRLRNHQFQLHRLDLNAEQPLQEIIWTRPAPECHVHQEGKCQIAWSPDDCWAAIWYDLHNFEDNNNLDTIGWFDVLYIVEMASQEIFEVIRTREFKPMLDPLITPDSSLMLIPWTCIDYAIDIYSCSQRTIIVRINDLAFGRYLDLDGRISFSPDSLRFAIAHATGIRTHRRDGQLEFDLHAGKFDAIYKEHELVAWSPDGSSIASWRPCPSMLHIIDAAQALLQGSVNLAVGPDEFGACLLWGSFGIVPVLKKNNDYARPSRHLSSMLLGCNPANVRGKLDGSALMASVKVRIGHCMPVLSPDGAFIAAVDPAGHALQVFDVQSGACISRQGVVVDQSRWPTAFLAWTPAGRHLMLQVQYQHINNQDKPGQELLAVFAF